MLEQTSIHMHDLRQATWMPKLEQEVRRYLNGESSGHDPWHAFRVRDLAIRIAQAIGADTEVVHAAALLHDIGHGFGRAEHAERGASLAADLLSGCSFPADKVRAVNRASSNTIGCPAGREIRCVPRWSIRHSPMQIAWTPSAPSVSPARSLLAARTGARSGIRNRMRRYIGLTASLRSTISTTNCSGCRATCTPNPVGAWRRDGLRSSRSSCGRSS
jgi:putative nucleotidyltransferase with HDIG domain